MINNSISNLPKEHILSPHELSLIGWDITLYVRWNFKSLDYLQKKNVSKKSFVWGKSHLYIFFLVKEI
jgi:hypothetical protein